MDNIFFRFGFGVILIYGVYINFKRAKQIEVEYDLIDARGKKSTPEEKIITTTNQNKKHKTYTSLAAVGAIITLFLSNTLVGFVFAFGSVVLAGKTSFELFERWSKKKPFDLKLLILSVTLVIILVAIMGSLYMPQLEHVY